MTWERGPVAAALVDVLTPLDATVSVFSVPPSTFNPPAYVVGYPTRVDYGIPTYSIDTATLPMLAAAGPSEVDRVGALLAMAKAAIEVDPSLGGSCQVCRVTSQTSWRILSVAGADILCADLVLEIRK